MKDMTGVLHLAVEKKATKTIPKQIFSQGALKVMRPQYCDDSGQLTYFILNPGGGYVDGDYYKLAFCLEPESDLYLTTQSATKIYETQGAKVQQFTEFELKDKSELTYIADPIIPYERSFYEQTQTIHMSKTASLFLSEMVTPGWSSKGQGFQYLCVNLLTMIYMEERLIVMDRLYLEPKAQDPSALGVMEDYERVASILAIHPLLDEEKIDELRIRLTKKFSTIHFGLSKLSVPGFALRALDNDTQNLENLIFYCQRFVRENCSGKACTQIKKF